MSFTIIPGLKVKKTEQNLQLTQIKDKLSSLPNNISELQTILKSLLNNIFINEYELDKQSNTLFNIADTTYENIYKILETKLEDEYAKQKYIEFLKFMIKELLNNNTDFCNNKGQILTAHYLDSITEKDKEEIEKIKKKYEDIYNLSILQKDKTPEIKKQIQFRLDKLYLNFKPSDIEDISKPRQINNYGNVYPNWLEDLLSVSKTSLYELKENDINIPNILEQNDEQFLQTLNERVKGLETCYENQVQKTTSKLKRDYYESEYIYESQKLNDITRILDNKDKISELCKNITWGTEDYKYQSKSDEDKFKEFKEFLEKNPEEIKYLKTFLPNACFNINSNGNVNIVDSEIKKLIKNKDRQYRQYIYGFYNDIKDFIPIKQFYEVYNMAEGWEHNCHPLVNWNLIANMMYNRCAISNNTQDIFPARFILPSRPRYKIKVNNNSDKLYYDIRNPKNLDSIIFKLDSKLKFLGFINIKYFYEKIKQFRNWIIFIFKNEFESHNTTLLDYISGEIPEYILVNFKFEQVNYGSLNGKIGVTYEELKDFKMKSELKQIFLYNFENDNTNFFIRTNMLSKYDIDRYNMKEYKIDYKTSTDSNRSYFSNGGNLNKHNKQINIKLNFSNNINLFNDILSNNTYKSYLDLHLSKYVLNIKNEDNFEIFRILYKYLLISSNEILYRSLINKKTYDKYLITKYKPLHYKYYALYETLIKFNIFHNINKNDNILNIGTNLTPIEIIKNNNYKINKIKCIIFKPKIIYLKNESKSILNYIKNFQKIYDLDVIFFTEQIQKILDIDIKNINNYQLFFYSIYDIDNQFWIYDNFYNIINLFIGIILCLKYTKIGGDFIINLGNVAYKQNADIYLILKDYFEESNLYYPEISNLYKNTGVLGVFKNYKGISTLEYNNLLEILNKLIKLYPDNLITNFNIYDKEERERFNITKPIDKNKKEKYITGFLSDDIDYSEIIKFNNSIYLDKLIFVEKVIELYKHPKVYLDNIKVPTPEQLTNAILYCKKYDIPYIDKFSNPTFQDKFGKQILHETYGLHEPIIYNFKTPFTLKIKQSISLKNISNSLHKKTKKTHYIKNKKTKNTKNIHKPKLSSFRFSKLFNNNNTNDYNTKLSSSAFSKSLKQQYTHKVNLIPELDPINNRIEQTTKLIDSRRDFDAPDSMQNLNWFEANKQFRYYKHKDDKNKIHLDKKVQKLLGDFSISQAWLKMYEIITDCKLIPTQRKGTYKSFHICEAPGTFINCINNYISTKTKYDAFDWKAQSLNSKNAKDKNTVFGDDFGLIRRHKKKWDWGVDKFGDITNIMNIKHYEKIVKDMKGVDLITSDCGLPMKCEGYEKVAFASLLTILYILPKGGSMVYKILTPIDEPIILNLIYLVYANCKELIFYKPIQNSQSREFYIVGKGYLGTETTILEKFFNVLKNFKEGEEIDLFNDMYPEAFVRQFIKSSTNLADNFIYTIERQIYFVDNKDVITKDFVKLFYDYYNEKNEDWVRKYKPIRLEKRFIM